MKSQAKRIISILVAIVFTATSLLGVSSAQETGSSIACANPTMILADTLSLGSAAGYGVLAGAAITNGGSSSLNGQVGVSPGTAITGIATLFKPGSATDSSEIGVNPFQAQLDITTANGAITVLQTGSGYSPIAAELGGQVVCSGLYKSDASFGLTGVLTLDGNGNPNSVFIFVTPAALTSAAASSIVLKNGAQAKNIYWQLGAAATLGASSIFAGNILAQAAITTGAGVHVSGRLFAKAAITLDSSTICVPDLILAC